MKPLWNAPSWGTIRGGNALAFTFLLIVIGPAPLFMLIGFLPLIPVVRSAWLKQPKQAWRTFVVVSFTAATLFAMPSSPWFAAGAFPFAPPPPFEPTELQWWEDDASMLNRTARMLVNVLVVTQLTLLPLAIATTIDTVRSRRARRESSG